MSPVAGRNIKIVWTKDGLNDSFFDSEYVKVARRNLTENGTAAIAELLFTRARRSDAGEYICDGYVDSTLNRVTTSTELIVLGML